MSTVDIDKLRYTITYEVNKAFLCDQATIDSDFNGSWQEWLDWFAKEEMSEVMTGLGEDPTSIKVGDPTTHLKAELLAKIDTLPVYDRSLFRDGYTDDPKDRRDMLERTPVIKLLEEL